MLAFVVPSCDFRNPSRFIHSGKKSLHDVVRGLGKSFSKNGRRTPVGRTVRGSGRRGRAAEQKKEDARGKRETIIKKTESGGRPARASAVPVKIFIAVGHSSLRGLSSSSRLLRPAFHLVFSRARARASVSLPPPPPCNSFSSLLFLGHSRLGGGGRRDLRAVMRAREGRRVGALKDKYLGRASRISHGHDDCTLAKTARSHLSSFSFASLSSLSRIENSLDNARGVAHDPEARRIGNFCGGRGRERDAFSDRIRKFPRREEGRGTIYN